MSAGIPVFPPTAVAIAIHAAITSDVHGITAAGAAITTAANASAQRTAMGVAYGSTGTTVCVGNDSRLSDARTPTAHDQAWSTITARPTTISGYGLTDAASTGANTFTGAQLIRAAATQDAIEILGRAGGTSSYKLTITPLALSASRTLSAPDEDGTIALRGANTFTGVQLFPSGTAAAPSGAFSSDPDTGDFRYASNAYGISCGGTTAAYLDAGSFYKVTYGAQANLVGQRANGTEAAPTKVLSGEMLMAVLPRSYYDDGAGSAGFASGTGIRFYATEDRNSIGNLGQRTAFLTIANGNSSASFRALLTENGTWIHGPVTATLQEISLASVGTYPRFQIMGTNTAGQSALLQARFDVTPGDCPQHILAKSRGTTLGTDFTAVAANDTLGIWAGEGADGTEFIRAGSIRCIVDGTVSTGVVPGRWEFYTNNASGVATKALTIDSSQNITPVGDVLVQSGKVVKVAGNQVITARQTAIADVSTADATDLTSAVALANANKAKINTTLAMLRTHGLIAT
jgi:hypothetical protein